MARVYSTQRWWQGFTAHIVDDKDLLQIVDDKDLQHTALMTRINCKELMTRFNAHIVDDKDLL